MNHNAMDGDIQPYITLARKLFNDPLWTKERFSYAQAWVDLIYWAYHSDGNFKWEDERYDLKRGQLCHTEKYLMTRWKWGRGRLRRTLKKWQKSGQIAVHRVVHTTVHGTVHCRNVITICNYSQYQLTPSGSDTQADTQAGTHRETQAVHNKNKLKRTNYITNYKNAPSKKSQKQILQTLKNQAHIKKVAESYKS